MKKIVEFTGSPKSAGFKTKSSFLSAISKFGFIKGKIKKRNNEVTILVTDDLNSNTTKMKLAKELGIDIMTYEELSDIFELEKELN